MFMALRHIVKKDVYEKNAITSTIYKITMMLIPTYLIAVIFSFISINNVASLGMTLMWGVITFYIYNLIFTNLLFNSVEKEA